MSHHASRLLRPAALLTLTLLLAAPARAQDQSPPQEPAPLPEADELPPPPPPPSMPSAAPDTATAEPDTTRDAEPDAARDPAPAARDTAAPASAGTAAPAEPPEAAPASPDAPPATAGTPAQLPDYAPPAEARAAADQLLQVFRGARPADRAEALGRLSGSELRELVPALAYVARHDDDPEVAGTATRILASLPDPAAVRALDTLTRDVSRRTVWRAAVEGLGAFEGSAAVEALYRLAWDEGLDSDKRSVAAETLRARHPQLVAERALPQIAGSRALPALGGAWFGGYTLWGVGTFSKTGAGPVIGGIGGTLIGAGTGFLLGQNLTTSRSLYYLSAMGWGQAAGVAASGLGRDEPDLRLTASLAIAGESLALGGAWLLADSLHLDAGEVLYTDLNTFAAVNAIWGLGLLSGTDDRRTGAALSLGAGALGMVVSGLTARQVRFDGGDMAFTLLMTAEGAWTGGFAPALFDNPEAGGGFLLGASLGLYLGEALSQGTAFAPGEVGQMLLTSAFGKSLGAGLSLLSGADDRLVITNQLVLGLSGLTAMALFGSELTYSDGDYVLVPASTLIGLWHGLAIGGILAERGDLTGSEFGGLTLAAPAAFGLASMGVSQFVDMPAWNVAMGTTGAVWGAWFPAWLAVLNGWQMDDALLGALIGSDLGLALSALLVSPAVDLDPTILAGASIGGIAASGLGTLAASLGTDDPDALVTTNLVASGLGLIGGGFVTWAILEAMPPSHDTGAGGTSLRPGALPPFAFGLQPTLDGDGRTDGVMMVLAFQP